MTSSTAQLHLAPDPPPVDTLRVQRSGSNLLLTWQSVGANQYEFRTATAPSGPFTITGSTPNTSITIGPSSGNRFYLIFGTKNFCVP